MSERYELAPSFGRDCRHGQLARSCPLCDNDTAIQRYCDLIRYLALPFDQNNPIFPEVDPWTGQDLPGNVALRRTWFEVIRNSEPPTHKDCVGDDGEGHKKILTFDPESQSTVEVWPSVFCPHCGIRFEDRTEQSE